MATATGLVITKAMPYRGDSEEQWSNKYWFTGGPPPDAVEWLFFAEALATHERECYGASVQVVGYVGYKDDDPAAHADWSYNYPPGTGPSGTLVAVAGEQPFAGDQAAMIEWKLERKNSRGKWVYLRKYFHGGYLDAAERDQVQPNMLTKLTAFADGLADGSMISGRAIRSQKQVEAVQDAIASPFVTTRTLKRRGKRP